MPLFDTGAYVQPNSRSHTRLVVSGGDAPAESWIHDPALPALFEYSYGGIGTVVIPKGYVVAMGPVVKDWETGRQRPTLTIANPGAATPRLPIGIAEYNVYQRVEDRLKHNQPNVITRDYIELPYIPNADDAALVKWGLVFGRNLAPGDYVKATSDVNNLGKLEKWVAASDPVTSIVGQVLGMEYDLPPTGWLKWVTPEIDAARSERAPDTNTSGKTPSYNYKTDQGGMGYDANYLWPQETEYRAESLAWMKTYSGIPGLTDGTNIAIRYGRGVVAAGQTEVVVSLEDGPGGAVKVVDQIAVNGVAIALDGDNVTIDLNAKTATVSELAEGDKVVVTFRTEKVVGILPGWDFPGSTGAVRILLKF